MKPAGKNGGFTSGQMDKIERRVQQRIDKGVPQSLWDDVEIMYNAYYNTGGACPSSAPLSNFQVTEKKKIKDLPI